MFSNGEHSFEIIPVPDAANDRGYDLWEKFLLSGGVTPIFYALNITKDQLEKSLSKLIKQIESNGEKYFEEAYRNRPNFIDRFSEKVLLNLIIPYKIKTTKISLEHKRQLTN